MSVCAARMARRTERTEQPIIDVTRARDVDYRTFGPLGPPPRRLELSTCG
jgi:hypothetical protein